LPSITSIRRRLRTVAGRREDGQTMTEYAFLLGLIAVAATAAFTSFGQSILSLFGPIVKAVAP